MGLRGYRFRETWAKAPSFGGWSTGRVGGSLTQIENFEYQCPPVSNAEEPRLVGLQDGTGAIDCVRADLGCKHCVNADIWGAS